VLMPRPPSGRRTGWSLRGSIAVAIASRFQPAIVATVHRTAVSSASPRTPRRGTRLADPSVEQRERLDEPERAALAVVEQRRCAPRAERRGPLLLLAMRPRRPRVQGDAVVAFVALRRAHPVELAQATRPPIEPGAAQSSGVVLRRSSACLPISAS
jgi:hypothetical protein